MIFILRKLNTAEGEGVKDLLHSVQAECIRVIKVSSLKLWRWFSSFLAGIISLNARNQKWKL